MIDIGKILKTHGFNGNLKVAVNTLFLKDILSCKHFFIDKLPYFVETIQNAGGGQFILKLEDINTKETAQNLCGKQLCIDKNQAKKWQQHTDDQSIKGFAIYDGDTYTGIVSDIIEMPQQMMIAAEINQKEILIPINEAFVLEINPEQRKIILNLPENYLQIFLA
jgi:16S rRNA processing protein RimM